MAVAIVLAAGSGSRMNSDIAKQYLLLKGREVLYYSLKTFQDNANISRIILVTRAADVEYCRNDIVNKYGFTKVTDICSGGKERYDSVSNGLALVNESNEDERVVMIHDGARPFVTHKMIDESVEMIRSGHKACTVGMPVKDTIKVVADRDSMKVGVSTPDRNALYQIQTPQTFCTELLKSAYERMREDKTHNITDDTMLVEQYMGVLSNIVPGAYENIKITTPEDLEIGEIFVEKFLEKF